jgi:hypothetical protein
MIVTTTWERRTFRVQAVRVTEENFFELAEWCGGTWTGAVGTNRYANRYITIQGRGNSTARARIGDWITRLGDANNYRVYQSKTFLEAFREIVSAEQRYAEVHQVVMNAMHKQDAATYNGEASKGMDLVADKATRDILALL